jgi:hypothetical protein
MMLFIHEFNEYNVVLKNKTAVNLAGTTDRRHQAIFLDSSEYLSGIFISLDPERCRTGTLEIRAESKVVIWFRETSYSKSPCDIKADR